MTGSDIRELPDALAEADELNARLRGHEPAVFLDYDGVLTPIVDRPEDATISEGMWEAVRGLAQRCTVCVVSGRDRPVVQELMNVDDLVVAGSHGFDIWHPEQGRMEHDAGEHSEELLDTVKTRLGEAADGIEGAQVEPKKLSTAIHYRHVTDDRRPEVKAVVDELLAEYPDELKVTPGKMVFEVQPKLDWHKGKAVLYLLETLGLDRDDVIPVFLGDDITDEDAFNALKGRGIGIFVGDPDDPEVGGRTTAADYVLESPQEVEQFLDTLAR